MTLPSYELISGVDPCGPLIFLCDHAGNALPHEYGTLGLEEGEFAAHVAFDIGAAAVTRVLALETGAPAVLGRWSRLLIDLNRGAEDPTLIMALSDRRIVPGNRSVDAAERAKRIAAYHAPYHAAIRGLIEEARAGGNVPVLVSIHSFTPVWRGVQRPWEVGVLWDRDARLAQPLLRLLAEAGFAVGNNEPYSGQLENDSMSMHGTQNGLPHVLIEIRQDLVASDETSGAFARTLKPLILRALEEMGQPVIHFSRAVAPGKGAMAMDESTRTALEAAVFRRLVAHLRTRTDVQNIDLMNLAGFCRNCLGDWYREAAAENGIVLEKDAAREIIYGMAPAEWKARFQTDATAEQKAQFARTQSAHS
ncbi:MAG TPA: DUF1244 domain-containing protein [Rhizomicrobium sp.]|jgi:predicted N-formylglutamate amidohydrolase